MNEIIEIEGMEFFAFHGCYETERVVGNKFMVYARIETDCSKAAQTDNIEDALSYLTINKTTRVKQESASAR